VKAVNLIPAEQRERSSGYANRSHGVVYVVLALLVGIALLALMDGLARHEVASKESEVAHYESQAQRVQAQASSLAPYKSFIALREGRENSVRQLVNSRFDWAHALSELGRVLPAGTSLNSLEGCISSPGGTSGAGESSCSSTAPSASSSSSSKSASGTGSSAIASATPAGSVPKLTLAGCATSQSTVARALVGLRLMDGVSEAELQSASKSTAGSAGGAGAGAGNCPAPLVSFTAKVVFQPLPTPPASAPAASAESKSVPASAGGGATGATGATPSSSASAAPAQSGTTAPATGVKTG
jgi:Tfp pilus assembly protein PilN